MRRLISSALAILYSILFSVSPLVSAQAANGDLSTPPVFELTIPATYTVNEAFDVTVKALKPDGTVNTTYEGSVNFDVDKDASTVQFPHSLNPSDMAYKFDLSAQGVHTFPKAFTFSKAGVYKITVIDETTFDEVTQPITITVGGGGQPDPSASVVINEPVAQTTVSQNSIPVSGTSKPTSTVNFLVAGVKQSTVTSDTNGAFSGTVTGLVPGQNTIKVEVFDGTPALIGSAEVTVMYTTDAPKITSLVLTEGIQVFAGTTVHVEASGDPGLKMVVVKFNDKEVPLLEDPTRLGLYTGTTKISSFEGEISPVVNIESFAGTKAEFRDLLHITVVSSGFENVKLEGTTDKKMRFTFGLKSDLDEIKYFKIKYGTKTGEYSQDVTTYEKSQIKEGDQYTWYIPNIEDGEYFATIIALDKDKQELPMTSGELTLTVLGSAETCFIDKVSGVTIKKSGSYSIITWDKLADAASYQIFKKDANGEYAMLDEVTSNSYKVNIDMTLEEEVFEDFQIRATCKNGNITGEGAYSESVSVQTGPAMIAFMMLMIASGAAFILMKRGYLR